MRLTIRRLFLLLCLWYLSVGTLCPSQAEELLRFATYNLHNLRAKTVADSSRLENLRATIDDLAPDVIGLQEVFDRESLELVFPSEQWNLLIDDNNNHQYDLALVVRKGLRLNGVDQSLNAQDDDFLFPDKSQNWYFPERRDVLFAVVAIPDVSVEIVVFVHHAKARVGGRQTTTLRREGAACRIADAIRTRFAGFPVVLLGDLNDTPDDASVNILETGMCWAVFESENKPGSFLVNLTEPLFAEGYCTWGVSADWPRQGDRIDARDSETRARNRELLQTDQHTGPTMLDQILVSPKMVPYVVPGSVDVYSHIRAIEGERASDHLPVYFDLAVDRSLQRKR